MKKIIKGLLRLLPKELPLLVPRGILKGKKWVIGSADLGCWFGSYESKNQKILLETVKNGDIVYDIGANVGFFTLFFEKLGASVYAFEPLSRNYRYLLKHRELNHSSFFHVRAAISDANSVGKISENYRNPSQACLSDEGEKVLIFAIDEIIKQGLPKPDFLKIDAEGNELKILQGAAETLKAGVKILCEGGEKEKKFLSELGYQIKETGNGSDFFAFKEN